MMTEERTAVDIAAELSDPLDGYDTANATDDLYYLLGQGDLLRAALAEALEIADDEAQYIPAYLLGKFGYAADLARLRAVLDRSRLTRDKAS